MSSPLVDDVRRGLGGRPLRLPPKWLYDDRGSELFEEITRLDDYYPFRAERAIFRLHADDVVAACDATTLVELGSGTSEKTQLLLDALHSAGRLRRFVALDVAEGTLRQAAAEIASRYPDVSVEAVVGDFTAHLGELPRGVPSDGTRLVAFLGGTIGNLYVEERADFLATLADTLDPGEWVLLGTDLVKPVDRLVAAYDDPGGVTADFVTNALRVLNRELGADFDLAAWRYVPLWDARLERMDLRLRAEVAHQVHLPRADLVVDVGLGEEIQVEISTKFRPDGVRRELDDAGFDVTESWTDPDRDFALTLARRV